jgi:hypothetical protein
MKRVIPSTATIVAAFAVVALACLSSHAECMSDSYVDHMFSAFVEEYGRSYSSAEEREYRRAVFADNLAYMNQRNAEQQDFELGITQFSDVSYEEWLGLRNSAAAETTSFAKSAKLSHSNSVEDAFVASLPALEDLPKSVDWNASGKVTAVQNQLTVCPQGCWAYSSVAVLESAWAIAGNPLVKLSERMTIDCATGGARFCTIQANPIYALEMFRYRAVCSEESYPMPSTLVPLQFCQATKLQCEGIALAKNFSYKEGPLTENEMLARVAVQPTGAWVASASKDFMHYTGGVFKGECGQKPDHAIAIVGYGTTEQGEDYWLIKNSFGTSWGMDGFMMLPRSEKVDQCGLYNGVAYNIVV